MDPSSILHNVELLYSILDFCDEVTRFNFILLSSKHHEILTSDASFKWRVGCLHREIGIYHPQILPQSSSTTTPWKDIFLCNLKRKDLWQKKIDSTVDTNNSNDNLGFHVRVSARFKPKNDEEDNTMNGKNIALPLHQRLALIQMNRKLKTKKEVFQALFQQGGWFGNEMRDRHLNDDEDDTRDEGDSKNEKDNEVMKPPSIRGGVHLIDPIGNFAVLVDPTKGLRKFDFDNVFQESCTQEAVYNATTMPLIAEFINGFNASCIVYGQTGSGKTHTMYGENDFKLHEKGVIPSTWGVVPRSCHEIFEAIEFRKKNINLTIDAEIAISYIEIFGDSVTDLLRGGKSCGQSKVAAQRYVLDGSSEVIATSMSDTLELLNSGEKQKRKAATAMNDRSSRAHSVFIIRMKQTCQNTGVTTMSRLFLADLGGSEQLKKSQPFQSPGNKEQTDFERKQRTREAVNINLGLLALKQCVGALRKKAPFVPYTDSKLTLMLSTGLGGDSKTAVIVCGAQEQRHGTETIAAMKFGQICRGILNTRKITTHTMLQDLLENINEKILTCEENIKKYERWESRDVERNCDNGKVEVRNVTVVTGAEEYREQLSILYRQKVELTGDTLDNLYTDSSVIEGFGVAHKYGLGKKVGKL
jgi:hypothetical protein